MSEENSIVIVPGLGNSVPEHWQSLLQAELSGTSRVEQTFWNLPVKHQWVRGLERHVRTLDKPLVLVGHSGGALTIVEWASRGGTSEEVIGALLVAPPDMEDTSLDMPPLWVRRLLGWVPISRKPLPFPTVLVTSTNDPMSTEAGLLSLARLWGSKIISIDGAGHINADSGYGNWPEAKDIVLSFQSLK